MKNKDKWQPTRFILGSNNKHIPNEDTRYVGRGSRFVSSILINQYEPLIKRYATGLLLDLGCGNVPYYHIYHDLVTDNVCVDWSNSLHENKYLDHEFNLNEPIPLESNRFDTILCTDVLEHIKEPHLLMAEIARLLKPGGRLILTVPFFYWIHEEPHDYFRLSRHILEQYCIDNGLKVIELEPYGGVIEIIFDIIAKNIAHYKLLSSIHFKMSRLIINTTLANKISAAKRKNFPLGYYLVAEMPKQEEYQNR